MPGKSRRKRGKQAPRRKLESRQHSTAAPVPVTPRPSKPAAPPETPSPSVTVPRQPATIQTIRYPYIGAELRTIGILAGMMVIILIILYFTLT